MYRVFKLKESLKVKEPSMGKEPLGQTPLRPCPFHVCETLKIPVPPDATSQASQDAQSWVGLYRGQGCGAGGCVVRKRQRWWMRPTSTASPKFTVMLLATLIIFI